MGEFTVDYVPSCPYIDCVRGSSPMEKTRSELVDAPKGRITIKYRCLDCGRDFIMTFVEGREKPEIQTFNMKPVIKPESKKIEPESKTIEQEAVNFDEVIKGLSVEVKDRIPTGGEYQRGSLLNAVKLGG